MEAGVRLLFVVNALSVCGDVYIDVAIFQAIREYEYILNSQKGNTGDV